MLQGPSSYRQTNCVAVFACGGGESNDEAGAGAGSTGVAKTSSSLRSVLEAAAAAVVVFVKALRTTQSSPLHFLIVRPSQSIPPPFDPFHSQVSSILAHDVALKYGAMNQLLIWLGLFEVFSMAAIFQVTTGATAN